jgi:hypothetical protein
VACQWHILFSFLGLSVAIAWLISPADLMAWKHPRGNLIPLILFRGRIDGEVIKNGMRQRPIARHIRWGVPRQPGDFLMVETEKCWSILHQKLLKLPEAVTTSMDSFDPHATAVCRPRNTTACRGCRCRTHAYSIIERRAQKCGRVSP